MTVKPGKSFFNVFCALRSTLVFAGVTVIGYACEAQNPQPSTTAMEKRIDAMIKQLSRDQKIALLGGAEGMSIRSEPSIGLPSLRMSDGPMGVRSWGPTTAYPPVLISQPAGTLTWRNVWGSRWGRMRAREGYIFCWAQA